MDHLGLQYSMEQISAKQFSAAWFPEKWPSLKLADTNKYFLSSVLLIRKKCSHKSNFTLFAYKVLSYGMFN